MRRIPLMAGVGAVVGTLALSAPAMANLIVNGSFETPPVAAGGFLDAGTGSTAITGWTVVGIPGSTVLVLSNTFSQAGVTFNAENGVQSVDLTGDDAVFSPTQGLTQTVATAAGHTYSLSYFVGNNTTFGTTSTVNVSLNGVPTYSDTNASVNATGVTYEQFSHTFLATGASTTLAFLNGDPSTDFYNGLDNVALTEVAPSVPEPASLALLGVGLLGLGVMRRRA